MGLSHSNQLSYWAAREGRSDDLVYHLREGGREVCLYRDKKGNTCLHAAAEGGHVACISVLLTAGASVNVANREGYIPLHLAVQGGHVPATRKLLDMGAQLHAETFTSHIAPIHLAAHRGSVSCIKILLEYGADINVQESWGQTPLMLAALRGHKEALIFILRNAACDTSVREHQYGGQVTHVAMETKELDTLKLLLDSGCDPNATRSSDGVCLLKLAIEHRFTEGVQLLLQYGARCHPGKLKDGRLSREPLVAMATNKWGQTLSLKEASRLAFRQALSPGSVEERCRQFKLTPSLHEYVLFRELDPSVPPTITSQAASPSEVPPPYKQSIPPQDNRVSDSLEGSII